MYTFVHVHMDYIEAIALQMSTLLCILCSCLSGDVHICFFMFVLVNVQQAAQKEYAVQGARIDIHRY